MNKMTAGIGVFCALVTVLSTFGSCGKKDSSSTTEPTATAVPTSATKLSFATDINPILSNSCGTSSCHGSGATQGVYVGNETAFKASSSKARVQDGSMPQAGSSQAKSFTADNKTKILQFLAQ